MGPDTAWATVLDEAGAFVDDVAACCVGGECCHLSRGRDELFSILHLLTEKRSMSKSKSNEQ